MSREERKAAGQFAEVVIDDVERQRLAAVGIKDPDAQKRVHDRVAEAVIALTIEVPDSAQSDTSSQ